MKQSYFMDIMDSVWETWILLFILGFCLISIYHGINWKKLFNKKNKKQFIQ